MTDRDSSTGIDDGAKPRRWKAIAAIVALLVAMAGFVGWKVVWSDGLPDGVVLKVGDHQVTEAAFNRRISVLEALYGVKRPTAGAKVDRFRRDAAKSVAVSLVLSDAAKAQGVEVPDKKARDALAKIIDEQVPDGERGFTRFLERAQVTEADVLKEVRLQLVTSLLFDQVTADVKVVTDRDVRAAFRERRHTLVTPERRQLSNIVVASRAEAADVFERLNAGEPFAAVASSVSLDGSSRDKGGALGLVAADELVPEYRKVVFTAKRGEVFGPVETQYGWNVGLVTAVEAPKQLTFAQVKGQLKARLGDERRYNAWHAWLTSRIADADVVYADAYRPADPAAVPSDVSSPAP